MRFLCTDVLTLTGDLVMSDKFRGATPGRLGEEDMTDQQFEDVVVQTLNFADLSNFTNIIKLMESSLECRRISDYRYRRRSADRESHQREIRAQVPG